MELSVDSLGKDVLTTILSYYFRSQNHNSVDRSSFLWLLKYWCRFRSFNRLWKEASDSAYRFTSWDLLDAVKMVKPRAVQFLVSRPEIDVNIKRYDSLNNNNTNEHCALSLAAAFGSLEILKILLDHPKININIKTGITSPIITWAVNSGNAEVVSFIMEKIPGDFGFSHQILLRTAVSKGYHDVVEVLIRDPSVNPVVFYDYPLRCATLKKFDKVVEVLMKDGRVSAFRGEICNKVVNVSVKDLSGRIRHFALHLDDKVTTLKESIATEMGIPVTGQRLLCSLGKQMEDDSILAEYYYSVDNNLNCFVILKGRF